MQNICKLSELPRGAYARVLNISSGGGMRSRLYDLGLIEGTTVSCVQKSPLGDPSAYLIRGAVIALRCEDSSCVRVAPRERR